MLRFPTNIRRLRSRSKHRPRLPFPAAADLRVAQLGSAANTFDGAECFSRERWSELESFAPHVLVGSPSELRRIAELSERGVVELASVDRAIFALTRCGEQPVSDVSRVVLWQAFGVPVYELFVGTRGALLASECEAHEGWHIEEGAKFSAVRGEIVLETGARRVSATGLTGRIESEPCPCGRSGSRLIGIEPLALVRVRRALAATA